MPQKNPSIYEPFKKAKDKDVTIITWNLAPLYQLPDELLGNLQSAARVTIIVGFSKTTHDLPAVLSQLNGYSRQGFEMRILANCHVKLWSIGKKLYVGSANLCAPSLLNLMVETNSAAAWEMLRLIKNRSVELSRSTNLKLVPQVNLTEELEPCIF